jgi:hypothetical protein
MTTLICPLCRDARLERLITIKGLTVGATVVAYQCAHSHHIFFVRTDDLSESIAAEGLSQRPKKRARREQLTVGRTRKQAC